MAQTKLALQAVITAEPQAHTAPYEMRALRTADIPAMRTLQKLAGAGQIINRSHGALRAHFNCGHSAVGIHHKGELVAQALIRRAGYSELMPGLTQPNHNDIAVIGGVIVAPAHRGKGLMGILIESSMREARQLSCGIAHARVRPYNENSRKGFLKKGFEIAAIGPSPDEPEHEVYFMYRSLTPKL